MSTINENFRFLMIFFCFLITACDNSGNTKVSAANKEHYTIKTGGISFLIPSDYLVDETSRIEAAEVAKIKVPPNNRDSRYEPHKYVTLMALRPDMRPVENGRFYKKAPPTTAETITFNLSHNGGTYQGKMNHAKINADPKYFNIEDLSKYEGKWVFGGRKSFVKTDMYFHVKNGRLVGYLGCRPTVPNPACNGSYIYNEHINLDIYFGMENFEWITKEDGVQQLIKLLDSWRIHSEEDKEL